MIGESWSIGFIEISVTTSIKLRTRSGLFSTDLLFVKGKPGLRSGLKVMSASAAFMIPNQWAQKRFRQAKRCRNQRRFGCRNGFVSRFFFEATRVACCNQ